MRTPLSPEARPWARTPLKRASNAATAASRHSINAWSVRVRPDTSPSGAATLPDRIYDSNWPSGDSASSILPGDSGGNDSRTAVTRPSSHSFTGSMAVPAIKLPMYKSSTRFCLMVDNGCFGGRGFSRLFCIASAAAELTVMPGSWPPSIAVSASVEGALSHMEPFFFFASSFFLRRFRRRRAPLDSLEEEDERLGDLRRLRPRERDRDRERDRFFLSSLELFLSSEEPFFFLSSEELFLSFLDLDGDRERDGLRDREDEELLLEDEELRDRRRPRERDGDGVGKSRLSVFWSGNRPMRDINTADTFLPSNGPSRNTQRCAGFDRPRMRCAAMGSRRYDDTNLSTACRNSRASFSRCCRLRSSRPRRRPRLLLRLRFFFSFFFASAPNAGGAAPNGSGFSTAGAGAGARAVGAKGSTAGSSSGASSSAFLALLALAAFASAPPRLEPVFFFFGEALGAILPIGTSSSESLFVSVACACNWLIGTSSSSLESFAGAGAGASLSASDAFRLVTRVPPRRPRAIVLAGLDGGP
mmetsp:Transcript_2737/g.6199  ORF Transcript_2737/g.6199 Transcript_2737/m.6199 type:complete len:530 (+) Transcript_2737:1175-2764(+)